MNRKNNTNIDELLNNLGRDGWGFVIIAPEKHGETYGYYCFFLKSNDSNNQYSKRQIELNSLKTYIQKRKTSLM